MDTVYDAEVIAKANGDLSGRKRGNRMDLRLSWIEVCLAGQRRAIYNGKLLGEYTKHVKTCRNDLIDAFIRRLADHGMKAARNTLSSVNYAKARKMKWPSHDQHLLAAAIEAQDATIVVLEDALAGCGAAAKREFGVTVVQL